MKRNYRSVRMKGYWSQRVLEHACGLLGCNDSPLILQGPGNMLSSTVSSFPDAMATEPAATRVLLKRCIVLCFPKNN